MGVEQVIIAALSHLAELIGPIGTWVRAWANDQVIILHFEFNTGR